MRPGVTDSYETSTSDVAQLVRQCLEEGASVDIDGLGVFEPGPNGTFRFRAHKRPRVFVAYVEEDIVAARRLYRDLVSRGFDAWLDKEKLLPGQNWPRAIEEAIRVADYVVTCFSQQSVAKRGTFHAELRYALDCATRAPLDGVFLVPVRIDECCVPEIISNQTQYVDLFPDWNAGLRRVLMAIRRDQRRRKR